jgi:hypothetical protein
MRRLSVQGKRKVANRLVLADVGDLQIILAVPQTITLFRVFVAAPSDVTEELVVIAGLVRDWNLQHGQQLKVRVELVNWRTHTRPATGKRPQALVNKRAFDACDLVIAVFWSRFGTPTGRAASGTEEEIRRGIRLRKPVLVYFSDRSAPGQKPVEHSRIEKFKRRFGQKALFGSYNSLEGFEDAARNHLASTMHELIAKSLLPK